MSGLDPILEAARTPDGQRRFFPAGQHPASAKGRLQLERFAEMGIEWCPLANELRRRLAVFEELESERKADYLFAAERSGRSA